MSVLPGDSQPRDPSGRDAIVAARRIAVGSMMVPAAVRSSPAAIRFRHIVTHEARMNWRTLDRKPPCIIAHRGASGLRPEHTLQGYALALTQGADVIEPDLVPSGDGILFARHEPALARSTDIAMHAEFEQRRRDGDWRADDFLAIELDRLRATQPFPGRARDNDGKFSLPRWSAILDWAAGAAQERGCDVVLYPEIKHPTQLAARGVDPVPAFIASVAPLSEVVEVRVQCFEVEALRRIHRETGLPCALLLDADADWSAAIAMHGDWLQRLGVHKRLLYRDGDDSGLVAAAHAAGLCVDAWTFRDDAVGEGHADIHSEMAAAMRLGVDGLFCDFPATGISVRGGLADS
ncbi:MAG TPA: glycerophosphodiester phosphodiesterase family protein [Arenimonas sp.]|nr:glycerophosphodiester phosphodiesterase family protein [Arenimonas sp.]